MRLTLKHRYADFTLDVKVDAGTGITALFGRSGAGKSTVINAIAGLLRPDEGHLQIDDETLIDTSRRIFVAPHKRRFATVFQDARLFPHLTVSENLDFGRRYAPRRAPVSRDDVIDLLGLHALQARAPATLSGGEKQRVAIGRALLSAPRLLLMDEPLASLDHARKQEILPYLEHLRDGPLRLPIIYVSHAVDEITRLADEIIILQNGKVAAKGALHDVMSNAEAIPLLGVREAGSVLRATITAHADDGLSTLQISGGTLELPGVVGAIGSKVRLRVMAQDVMLARTRPTDLSALNVLPVRVRHIHQGDGPGAAVALDAGNDVLLARVTRRAVAVLDLKVDDRIFAILKSTAVAPASIGR